MNGSREAVQTRRALLKSGLKTGGVLAGALMVPGAVSAAMRDRAMRGAPESLLPPNIYTGVPAAPAARPVAAAVSVPGVDAKLMQRAMAALEHHDNRIAKRDRIAIADFAAASGEPRFHLVNVEDGRVTSKLVAHGSGSDPAHTGWLKRFSNENGSNASCDGTFVTADYYVGKHGKSQRLIGLDQSNSNALDRAIVVHAAWYANPEMVAQRGMLGRSQGCFAVGERELAEVFERLGPGRMIYAAKI